MKLSHALIPSLREARADSRYLVSRVIHSLICELDHGGGEAKPEDASILGNAAEISDDMAFEIVKVWLYGRDKHQRDAWLRCPAEDHIAASERHLARWKEDPGGVDADSGLSHDAHALARSLMNLARAWLAANEERNGT